MESDMKKTLIIFSLVLLAACGPSQEEKQNIAQNACSIMGETKKSDSLFRTQTMIDAREKIGGGAFVRGDDAIIEAFEFGVCQQLVLNESYDEILQPLKDAKQERERIAAERQAEQERIAAEKRAEEQRIADSKPTVKEEFFSNGQLKSRTNYQPKSDGGKKDGVYEGFNEKGQLTTKGSYKDGKGDGPWEYYFNNGQIGKKAYYEDGKEVGLWEEYDSNGVISDKTNYIDGKNEYIHEEYYKNVLIWKRTYKNGVLDGLTEQFHGRDSDFLPENEGKLLMTGHYKDGKKVGLWVNYHKNERLESKVNWKDGEQNGLSETYSRDGLTLYRKNYKDGEENGLRETYKYRDVPDNYLDGKYFWYETINIKDGKQDGVLKRQYLDGDVREECYKANYRNGRQRLDMSNCTE